MKKLRKPLRTIARSGRRTFAIGFGISLAFVYSVSWADDLKPEERKFSVYFTEEDAEITPEAQAVIREVKLYYERAPGAYVEVWGHADRQGTRYFNFMLSKRRASAAARALIAAGADAERIKTVWSGETQLPHPTNDGVPLSLNRVAIIRVTFREIDRP